MFTVRDATFAAAMSLAVLGGAVLSRAFAEITVEAGGAPMYPSKNIIENTVKSKDHTTLVVAVKAAGLVETLQGERPFTVFATVNTAFDKLPKGTLATLLKPENKATLTAVLTCHVIPGKISSAGFVAAVKKGGGEATYKTVEGEALTARQDGRKLEIIDAKGGKSFVTRCLAWFVSRRGRSSSNHAPNTKSQPAGSDEVIPRECAPLPIPSRRQKRRKFDKSIDFVCSLWFVR
jgi:uncharacterized surface protein with fasciclin (FAS1) repeats